MPTKLASPTLKSLNSQIAALQAQAEVLRKKEIGKVIAQARDAIAHYGITAEDLGFGKSPGAAKKAEGSVFGARRRGVVKKAAKPVRAPKYADDQGHTWSGMGKRPTWFKNALAAGKTPEELLAKN